MSPTNNISQTFLDINLISLEIIAGGETGVERDAIDIDLKYNLPYGGYCPKERVTKDGIIPDIYKLTELDTTNPRESIRLNVNRSDRALVLLPNIEAANSQINIFTTLEACETNKPLLTLNPSQNNITKVIKIGLMNII